MRALFLNEQLSENSFKDIEEMQPDIPIPDSDNAISS